MSVLSSRKIVIAGSMKANEDRMKSVADYYKGYSRNVVNPWDVPFNHTQDPMKKVENRKFYYRAIDNCDVLIVVNKNHVGTATCMEIGYALAKDKPIEFWDKPDVLEFESMIRSGEAHYNHGDETIP